MASTRLCLLLVFALISLTEGRRINLGRLQEVRDQAKDPDAPPAKEVATMEAEIAEAEKKDNEEAKEEKSEEEEEAAGVPVVEVTRVGEDTEPEEDPLEEEEASLHEEKAKEVEVSLLDEERVSATKHENASKVDLHVGSEVAVFSHTEVEMLSLEAYMAKYANILDVDSEVHGFDAVVDWAKSQTKSLLTMIKEQTKDTFHKVKGIVLSQLSNFKTVLAQLKAKCVTVMNSLKGKLYSGVQKLKTVAVAELPKFYKHLEGLKTRLTEAHAALAEELKAGSLAGAGKVLQQQLALLWDDTKTAAGGLKDQALASATALQAQVKPIIASMADTAKTDFTAAFSSSVKDTTNLINDLWGDVRVELITAGKGITEEVRGAINGGNKASLIEMDLDTSEEDLPQQLEDLEEAREDLAEAAAQAGAVQTEQSVDVGADLGRRIGRYFIELMDTHLTPAVKKLKEKALNWLNEKLTQLRKVIFNNADDVIAKLTDINGVAGSLAKSMWDKYGDSAEEWSERLQGQALGMLNATLKVQAARDALANAIDETTTKAMGKLQGKILTTKGKEQEQARADLIAAEEDMRKRRQVAYEATEAASKALQALAAKSSEDQVEMRLAVATGEVQAGQTGKASFLDVSAPDLDEIQDKVVDTLWEVALDFGRKNKKVLEEAAAALAEDAKSATSSNGGWDALVNWGAKVANFFIKTNSSGQCSDSSYRYCCGWGTPCDCSKDADAPGQCSHSSYTFCCAVGNTCDCSKPKKG
mmetsp:Transcript_47640/g.101990  ORF Transcript_47640/g.101990 Transcript_47640/m.101990 type:complete len:757 (-) Transcript_47640:37-2307(-)